MSPGVRYAAEWEPSGIAVAAHRCMRALLASGVDVAWEPLQDHYSGRIRASNSEAAPSWLRALRRRERVDETLVLHSVPFAWDLVASELSAPRVVGHSVWELEVLPQRFIDSVACVDEIWVPTEWNKRAYEEAMQKPIHVLPHIAEATEPGMCPIEIDDDTRMVLLDSAWDWRKRPDRAIEAYLHAFTADDPVVLVVKTTPYGIYWPGGDIDVLQIIANIRSRFPRPAAMIVETGRFDEAAMRGLIARADCSLSLTSSEGWGLGAFDAACLGIPVLITGYGGHLEWLGADYPGLLPYQMVAPSHPDKALFAPDVRWAFPDCDAAIDLLRAVVHDTAPDLVAHAQALATELQDRYSSERIGPVAAKLLGHDPTAAHSPQRSERAVTSPTLSDTPKVVILTPIKDTAHRAEAYVDRILRLDYPRDRLRVAVLASDSTDGTATAFGSAFERLREAGIGATVFERDFGYRVPDDLPRWDPSVQLERRIVLAKSRNHLLARGLADADFALWLDVDVIDFPDDVIHQLLAVGGDIVHPRCVSSTDGSNFDLNAWTDHGRWHLDDYVGHELVELHAVGGTMLLVRADCHRDGLVWPAYRHGVANPRVRTDASQIGRPELGEVETEGLAIMADDMGLVCWGLPDLVITHE